MKRVLLAVVVLGAMTSAAVAEPKKLADADLRGVAAGFLTVPTPTVGPVNVGVGVGSPGPVTVLPQFNIAAQTSVANAIGVFNKGLVDADAANTGGLGNTAGVDVSSAFMQIQP